MTYFDVGAVVIGRNEGKRLEKCLKSLLKEVRLVVYVDSGSTDDSVTFAQNLGVVVVELDLTLAFTAARARNEGFSTLCDLSPEVAHVQFVDGDCEVVEGWLNDATGFLKQNDSVAVVCGRRRERSPEESIYNMLCDIEWETPIGETKACGGDALIRVDALKQVNGFQGNLIAGEEPELCVRLRLQGWKIWRLDSEMTLHDAAMLKFNQWWKRSIRSGYAFATGAHLHGKLPEKHWVKETRSIWFWGLFVPILTVIFTYFFGLWSLMILAIYPLQVVRLTLIGERGLKVNFLLAFYLVLGKFPEMLGALKFLINRVANTKSRLIEYK